ncbi:hypothetical protein GLOIN_2v1786702 [Rhizophagus irregularis DAOM 181602=DAOM 197198]|uniref:Uncharacterized protein n=1 Tax=Rhizophagus irregularis (strain DAOM 181602 / DAOM 197198 / MUCL 43194) TaxID=747089 RepID=A0A2P4P7L7_RHIID|nr:hypothetical protein GLOIN_2v1786702 [Rhizophagus irregularis DAOM 181602=DAOM 197198]POG61382.1 hypothetical protein GLOIN_2v1786702 [Rhizophagus irregularis DAOM 181602=DAOM 197198]GET58410.1 hypothetical protein GLOIN_2v1786702 [Rhizophagus irregularis DAOM 181602=DAOM 197198]|eukprot:XP_025168248.1 hypothetical protein GLOIN_2v1786702 [Rhizophagus irregularis DAOM 181602=DAOM 197198]
MKLNFHGENQYRNKYSEIYKLRCKQKKSTFYLNMTKINEDTEEDEDEEEPKASPSQKKKGKKKKKKSNKKKQ